jgi:hypothetical protein
VRRSLRAAAAVAVASAAVLAGGCTGPAETAAPRAEPSRAALRRADARRAAPGRRNAVAFGLELPLQARFLVAETTGTRGRDLPGP